EVDSLERCPHDPKSGRLETARQLEWGLSAELDRHAVGALALADGQHLLETERLEVKAIGCVVIGRDRLRVAVHHHGLVAEGTEALRRVDAAVVDLDALADAVRSRAEDQDSRAAAGRWRFVRLAPRGVVVRRRRLDLTGTRVDAPVDGTDAAGAALGPDSILRRPASRRDLGIGPALTLESQEVVSDERVEFDLAHGTGELTVEPRMCALAQRPRLTAVKLARPLRLAKGLDEGAADPHCLTDRLHLGAQRRVGAGKLLEGEPRELDDDVIERRLEARRGRAGEVVRDLVERITDGELRRHLCDRIAGRFRREGRR